jgi:very-short-patch-repair endonuclease
MPRTIIDLASMLPEEALDIALDSAIRAGMWRSTFRERFDALSTQRLPGLALLRRIVQERETEQGVTGSAFERRLLRLIKRSGLPLPVCQHPVRNESVTAFIDFAYPEFGIAIEADGYRWHDGRVAFERDRLRTSELASWGWRVIQVTWLQLKYHPVGVVRRIERALATPAIVELRSV